MSYTVDLTLSNKCNFNCKYCSLGQENKIKKEKLDIDKTIIFLDKLLDPNNNLLKNNDELCISVYGGEPSIEYKNINKLIDHYINNNRVQFMLYTNGSNSIFNIDFDRILKLPSRRHKFVIQVSFDGRPIHDKERVIKDKGTSSIVVNTIEELSKKVKNNNNIYMCIKSTIGYNDFNDIYDSYLDIYDLASKYNCENVNINYGPTLDLHDRKEYIDNNSIEDFKNSIFKISKHIIKNKKSYFLWLNEVNEPARLCSMGAHLISVNVDGSIYPCHSFYDVEDYDKKLLYGNIEDFDIFDKINHYKKYYSNLINYESTDKVCNECFAGMCRKCNTILIGISDKEKIEEQLIDYRSSINNCLLYKEAAKILIATKRILK
jgi:radical SAM protein with 4Fe4S-binding SPASM domain